MIRIRAPMLLTLYVLLSLLVSARAAPKEPDQSVPDSSEKELRQNTQALLDALAPGDVAVWKRLRHALMRSVVGAQLVGGRALLVNALDEEAARFWRLHGFVPSKDDPHILFRSISDVAASLKKSGLEIPSE